MKKNIFLLAMVMIGGMCSAQQPIEIIFIKAAPNNAQDSLHRVANEFSDEVGRVLKEQYPARVSSVDVTLQKISVNLVLTYSAIIVPSEEEYAHFYFDHRGSLSVGSDKDVVESNAKKRCSQQILKSVPKFHESFGWITVFCDQTETVFLDGYFWNVSEGFITATKKEEVKRFSHD